MQESTHTLPLTQKSTNSSKKNFLLTASLGGLADLFIASSLHPVDTVKTRLKANSEVYMPFLKQVRIMYKTEGPFSYFRGLTCSIYGSFIAGASYFYIYEKLKYTLNKQKILSQDAAPFVAAFVGSFLSDLLYLPFDVIRTRMQIQPGTYDYKNILDGFQKVLKSEGPSALYLGGPVFFALSAITSSLFFGFYEILNKTLKPSFPTENNKEVNVQLSVCSSALAASFSAFLANPLDVLITRMQSVDTSVQARYTILGLMKQIYQNEGPIGFMKGVTGTMLYYTVFSVVMLPTYEILKAMFNVDLSE